MGKVLGQLGGGGQRIHSLGGIPAFCDLQTFKLNISLQPSSPLRLVWVDGW